MSKLRDNLIWLAGLLEGEGCFYINESKNIVAIKIAMVDKDIIERVCKILNQPLGKIPERDAKHQKQFYMYVTGSKALGIAMSVYSLMGVRRQVKIKKMIEVWRGNRNYLLKDFQVKEIRRRYLTENLSQANLAEIYGVKRSTIQSIIERRNWKNI